MVSIRKEKIIEFDKWRFIIPPLPQQQHSTIYSVRVIEPGKIYEVYWDDDKASTRTSYSYEDLYKYLIIEKAWMKI